MKVNIAKNSNGSKEARQKAYNKWRPGSNAATHMIMANLIREKYAFYFGTTSTGDVTWKFFDFLKKLGYQIRLIHMTAPDDIRWESIKERNKTFIQTTEEDIRIKGQLLPQRINDTFLAYADKIDFYYRDGVKKDAQLVAKWIRNKDSTTNIGALEVIEEEQYGKIKAIHNDTAKVLNRSDLLWKSTVENERNSKITFSKKE